MNDETQTPETETETETETPETPTTDTRTYVATSVLCALIAGRHADYGVSDEDIAKSVDVADRLLARLEGAAPQEAETEPPEPTAGDAAPDPNAHRKGEVDLRTGEGL